MSPSCTALCTALSRGAQSPTQSSRAWRPGVQSLAHHPGHPPQWATGQRQATPKFWVRSKLLSTPETIGLLRWTAMFSPPLPHPVLLAPTITPQEVPPAPPSSPFACQMGLSGLHRLAVSSLGQEWTQAILGFPQALRRPQGSSELWPTLCSKAEVSSRHPGRPGPRALRLPFTRWRDRTNKLSTDTSLCHRAGLACAWAPCFPSRSVQVGDIRTSYSPPALQRHRHGVQCEELSQAVFTVPH